MPTDAHRCPPTGRFDGEQRVRGLGLGVRDLRVVSAMFELQVIEVDAGAHVRRRAQ